MDKTDCLTQLCVASFPGRMAGNEATCYWCVVNRTYEFDLSHNWYASAMCVTPVLDHIVSLCVQSHDFQELGKIVIANGWLMNVLTSCNPTT